MASANRDLHLIVAAQLADLVTFYAAAAIVPVERELNPIAQATIAVVGLGGVLLVKVIFLGGFLWAATRIRGAPDWVRLTGLGFALGSGLAGAAANLVSLAFYAPR